MGKKIIILHSDCEQLLSQHEELRETVRQLRSEMELLKNGRNSKMGSTGAGFCRSLRDA